jgi:multimeric flavodoxin WrbA
MIAQKIEEADGVIFVSLAYSMHVPSLFKRFVDRFACNFTGCATGASTRSPWQSPETSG